MSGTLDPPVEADLVSIPGGSFLVGTDEPWVAGDGEDPARRVQLAPFRISRRAVSVELFERFVTRTGYVTDAERLGWSFVFVAQLDPGATVVGRSDAAPWWLGVSGASWRRPGGRIDADGDHSSDPAVHISWNDAHAFCSWAGCRLPAEAEWERAAAGGREGLPFPWGSELEADERHHCNVWQGTFPSRDTGADGFRGTAPVDAFEPNRFGLYNAIGNVWEWCDDRNKVTLGTDSRCCNQTDGLEARVQKGGSYLCHESYCARYRIQARIGNPADSSTANAGFRVAAGVGG